MSDFTKISPSATTVKRASDIVAALAPPPKVEGESGEPQASPTTPSVTKSVASIVPGVAGGAVGAYMWREHRVLGFLAGHAVGANMIPLLRGGGARKAALCQIGVESAGIGGALLVKKHPVMGWIGGVLAGTALTALVPGSAAQEAFKSLKEGLK